MKIQKNIYIVLVLGIQMEPKGPILIFFFFLKTCYTNQHNGPNPN